MKNIKSLYPLIIAAVGAVIMLVTKIIDKKNATVTQ